MHRSGLLLAAFFGTAAIPLAAPTAAPAVLPLGGDVALQAGRVQLSATSHMDDATILVKDGKIIAIGTDVDVPAGVRVVDYGDDAVIAPGLVCADSSYGSSIAGPRTAEPTVLAVDNFDPYSEMFDSLRAGVTSVYMAPSRSRLVAGQGAVVKTGGEANSGRVVSDAALLHGSVTAEARRTPGYWVPPVPATVDVGLGLEQAQLPRTTMGAVVALRELVALAGGEGALDAEYGPYTGAALKGLIDAGTPWRMNADTPEEVRALLGLFTELKLPLVLDGVSGADEDLAKEIAAAGVTVIAGPHVLNGADFGKGDEPTGPNHALVSILAKGGADVVIATTRPGDLRFTAALAQRGGGLDAAGAFHAVTLGAAEVLGVADRVGSLAVGKDADFAVFAGSPMDLANGVTATWIGGELVWEANARTEGPTVIEVEELHLGDGHVLRPGQILIRGGRIQEVGERVAHPSGAVVLRGHAAMPGMIDALGHLGLEGSRQRFSPRFPLERIVEPGDATDRRVARAGVTTVNLGGRDNSGHSMVYKPADDGSSRMIVDSLATIRLAWSHAIPSERGEAMRKVLEKAQEYDAKWRQYEQDLANYKPAPPEEAPKEEQAVEAEAEEEAAEEDKDKKKEARPVTGEWRGKAKNEELKVELDVRFRLLEDGDLKLTGNVRSEGFEEMWDLTGHRDEFNVHLVGTGPNGEVTLELELDKKEDKLAGKGTHAGNESEITLTRVSEEFPVVRIPERGRPEAPDGSPKDMPKSPGIDPDLEPIRKAMSGKGALFVSVSSSRDAIEATAACNAIGVKPVIWSGDVAAGAASSLRGKVAGAVVRNSGAIWAEWGVPVAFASGAEEGAGELSLHAARAVAGGMSPTAAVRALTADAAAMLGVGERIGKLLPGLDADIVLLDGSPLDVSASVVRTWVNGKEIR